MYVSMAKRKLTFDAVREIGLAMPDVEDGATYGKSALKVRGNLLACLAVHKSAEPDSLVVRIDLDQRAALLAEAPDTYYITDHYLNYPAVLVRLGQIDFEQLRDLLSAAWRFVTEESGKRPRRRAKGSQKPKDGTQPRKTHKRSRS